MLFSAMTANESWKKNDPYGKQITSGLLVNWTYCAVIKKPKDWKPLLPMINVRVKNYWYFNVY